MGKMGSETRYSVRPRGQDLSFWANSHIFYVRPEFWPPGLRAFTKTGSFAQAPCGGTAVLLDLRHTEYG